MKFKKLVLAVSSILAISAVAGCKGNGGGSQPVDPSSVDPSSADTPSTPVDPSVDPSTSEGPGSSAGELLPGYTSLANPNAHGAIDEEGYYHVGELKFKTKDVLKTTYSTEPNKDMFNYLTNSWEHNSFHYCNMVDGLVENDQYGNIVGALALGFKSETFEETVGEETFTRQRWTFQLREDANWYRNDTGEFYARVTADDFVEAAKYVLDSTNGSATTSMYTNFILNAQQYLKGKIDDFGLVGVKAAGKFLVEYTLTQPAPYFPTVLTYSPYLPVNHDFLEETGTDFGTTVDNVLVNGAFRVTAHVPNNIMIYTKNENYYDAEHVYLNRVERKFVSSALPLSTTREWFEAELIDSFSVSAKDTSGYKKYVIGDDEEHPGTLKNPASGICNGIQSYYGATWGAFWNFNRNYYIYGDGVTPTTEAQRKAANEAIYNTNFRLGFVYGLDAEAYMEYRDPAEPYNYVVRGYTNKNLDSAGGKDYTDFVNDVYNEKNHLVGEDKVSLIGIDNGGDPVHNPEKANDYFALAKAELDEILPADSYPIVLDVIGSQNLEVQAYQKAMLDAVEAASVVDGVQLVRINWNIAANDDIEDAWQMETPNYDLSLSTGWGPDYADPYTFACTWIEYGDMVEYSCFALTPEDNKTTEVGPNVPQKYQDLIKVDEETGEKDYTDANIAMQHDILGDYTESVEAANAIIDGAKKVERFQAFAEAEYDLIYTYGIFIPYFTRNGYTAAVAKTVPWQAGIATYGLTENKFKNVVAIEEAITKEQRAYVTEYYEEHR